MTDMQIPDFMPQLRKGAGATPQDGGCLVQVAGFLADGVSWTDKTPCVHPLLSDAAIRVNDIVNEEVRQSLLPLAPRLVGTGNAFGSEADPGKGLGRWALEQVLNSPDGALLGSAITLWKKYPPREQIFFAQLVILHGGTGLEQPSVGRMRNAVDFLAGLIDEFDRLTGRTQSGVTVSEDDWKRVTEYMKAGV